MVDLKLQFWIQIKVQNYKYSKIVKGEKNTGYYIELNSLSAYVSKILISLAKHTNNNHLIDNETINRCQNIPKDYMMETILLLLSNKPK